MCAVKGLLRLLEPYSGPGEELNNLLQERSDESKSTLEKYKCFSVHVHLSF